VIGAGFVEGLATEAIDLLAWTGFGRSGAIPQRKMEWFGLSGSVVAMVQTA